MPVAIGFALFNLGAPLALVNAAVGVGIAGAIVHTAIGIAISAGISYLTNILLRAPVSATPSDGQIEVKQPVPPRVSHYGQLAFSGFIGFYESQILTTDSDDPAVGPEPTLWKINLLQSRFCSALVEVKLDNEIITRNGAGFVLTPDKYIGGSGYSRAKININFGTDDQTADQIMLDQFSAQNMWTTNHRLRGITYAVCRFSSDNPEAFTEMFPNRDPTLTVVARWNEVYDPRLDTTTGGSGSHRHDDPSTWAYSNNPALAALDFLTHSDGYNRPVGRFDLASFRNVADTCDESVSLVQRQAGKNNSAVALFVNAFGDMTNPTAVFDNVNSQASGSCASKTAATSAYIGARLSHRIVFGKVIIRGSNNQGFVNGINPSVTINIRGKNSAAPSSATDGTIIGTLTFTDTGNESTGRTINTNGNASSWQYIFAQITHNGAAANMFVAELDIFSGGSERRYRIATSVYMTEKRTDVLKRLLEACDATLMPTADGKWKIVGGEWVNPAVTIDYDLGHIIRADFAAGVSSLDRYNELAIKYMSPVHDYTEIEGDPWQNTTDPDLIDGIVETRPFDILQVPSHSQARRLAKLRMARDNPKWVITIETNYYGLNMVGERCITLKMPELAIDGPFWVESLEMKSDGTGVLAKLRSASEESYDWDPATEEGTPPNIPRPTDEEFGEGGTGI